MELTEHRCKYPLIMCIFLKFSLGKLHIVLKQQKIIYTSTCIEITVWFELIVKITRIEDNLEEMRSLMSRTYTCSLASKIFINLFRSFC